MNGISVIIPSNHDHHELLKVVYPLCKQTYKPTEIIIIDSSLDRGVCPEEITALCNQSGVKLIYSARERAMPGEARNIGLDLANCQLIAFIDVQTIPRLHWLETSIKSLACDDISGVFGSTFFLADTTYEKLVRDGFYGLLPVKTLPGSIFKSEVFAKAGKFIDWVRAGEDTEWMLRLELLKISTIQQSSATADYVGLIGSDMKQLLKKWHRNYSASKVLPHFFPQKLLLWLVFYPMIVVIAFNWNNLIAGWRMDSPFYIGHLTKTVFLLPILIYVIVRGLLLPLRRGVGILRLIPARFILITLICLFADIVKFLVFSIPKDK